MSASAAQAAPSAPAAARRFRMITLIPTLAIDVVAPITVLKLLEHAGVSLIWALAGAALAPALNNLRSWVTSRRLEPLGILVVGFSVIGAVASLLSGNVFYSLIKDFFLTGTFGLVFLASLLFARPRVYYVIRQFLAGGDEARIRIWNDLWSYATVRSAMRQLTIIWALVFLAEALIRIPLVLSLSPDTIVTISPMMGVCATVLLVVLTQKRMHAMGRRLALTDGVPWPL